MTDTPEIVEEETRSGEPAVIVLPDPPPERRAPWRGRRRVTDARDAWLPPVRCTAEQRTAITDAAANAGLSVGAWMRARLFGSPGPRARPSARTDRDVLVKLLAELGKIGSNHNQLARAANTTGEVPSRADFVRTEADIQTMRSAVLKALGYAD